MNEIISNYGEAMIFLFGLTCTIMGMILIVIIQKIVKAVLNETNRR